MIDPIRKWWTEDVGPEEKPGLRMLAWLLLVVLLLAIVARAASLLM